MGKRREGRPDRTEETIGASGRGIQTDEERQQGGMGIRKMKYPRGVGGDRAGCGKTWRTRSAAENWRARR